MIRRRFLHTLLLSLALAASVSASAADITNASLEIQGIGLSVETTDAVTTALDVPTTVQTSFGGKMNEQALSIQGLLAVGDLTGPGLDTPLELSTAPGHKFQIPGMSKEGVYTLSNVRLMKGRELLQYASPSAATIIVADLFKTKVEVRQLTPEEIRARGIPIDARNFEVYEYTLSFIIRGEEVRIPFPVIVDPRTRAIQAMPIIDPYKLPPVKTIGVGRFTPPDVIPVQFENDELPPEERNTPKEAKEPGEPEYKRPPIPAAIVIPNSLAVMHQFFAVIMTVQNGAPDGSTARLENLTARIKVPTQLRTASSVPPVALGQAVPIVDKATGVTFLIAQAKGEAEWNVEALKPGTHTIEIELRGTLKENGQQDVPLVARPRASVVVHDTRFNIAFSHPEVVRKGIEYTTYSFVTNSSPTTQTIRLGNSVPPCEQPGEPNVCRIGGGLSDELTIPSGETRTVEYRLRSGVTGKVFATAASIDSEHALATAQLHMGVSDTGIPLSPTTLIMPHYAQYVNDALVGKYLQILGLGYSVATAPATTATARLPRVIKADVYRRAVDIAQAGQAIFLANDAAGSKRDALAALSLDLLGNSAELSEWDELRRREKYARAADAAVVSELAAAGLTNGTTFETFIDDFAKAVSHRPGYVAALVHGPEVAGKPRPYALSIRGVSSGRVIDIPSNAQAGWIRDLPWADVSTISSTSLGRTGELGLVGRWTSEDLELLITPSVDGPFRLELLYPDAAADTTMRAHLELIGGAGQTLRVPISRGTSKINALLPNGGIAATGNGSVVPLTPLRVVGIRQDLYLDENGHKASVLFNRPVAKVVPATDLRTKFHATIDMNKDGVVVNDEPRVIYAAALQESERVIDLTFAYVLTTNVTYEIAIDPLVDPRTNAAVTFGTHVPKIDNDRPAGIIYGKFVKGDNTPLANHEVLLFSGVYNPETYGHLFVYLDNGRQRVPQNIYFQPAQITDTKADGSYLFEFVRREFESGFDGSYRLFGHSDNLTKYTHIDGHVRLPGRVHFVNLQLLGRGSAEGYVRYNNGEPVKNGNVTVGSTVFEGVRTAKTNDQGFYKIEDLPVGPLAFTATDADGNIGYAAGEIGTPGEIEQQNVEIYRQPVPKNGRVHGTIRRSDTNEPVAGASVGIFNNGYPLTVLTTDANGQYSHEKVPAGFISVTAAEWSVSRTSASTDFDLKGDEVREVNLILTVSPTEKVATVTGTVLREDPLYPGDATKYQPVAGALVKIYGMRIVTADEAGRFEVPNVPVSRSFMKIQAYDPVSKRIEDAPLPQLTEAGPNNVPILLRGLGKGIVRARVLNARGEPVDGAEMLLKAGNAYYVMNAKGDGVYELGNVPVGPGYQVRTGNMPASYKHQEATSIPISVAFAGQVASVGLRLPGKGQVHVNVKGTSIPSDGGEPILTPLITEVTLRYSFFNSETLATDFEEILLSTNNNGLPGDAVFTNIPAMKSYTVTSAHPLGHSSGAGALAFEGDLATHTLTLSNLGHIFGTVYAIDGVTPVPGATVRMADGRQDQGIVLTGLDGKFAFRNVAPGVEFELTAESTQAGIYRIGQTKGNVPKNGGVINTSVTLLERGQIEGRIVYSGYKVYDPLHPEKNVPDTTPNDLSDNAPVPMARLYMRELDFPRRDLGTSAQPLTADLAGRFAVDNVFVGRLRATAWSPENPDLRGDWTATLTREGELLTPYIAIGTGGTGVVVARVTNPNAQNAGVENAEVYLYRGGLFDIASTGPDGTVRFEQVPVGTYTATAYSKALGKSGKADTSTVVTRDAVTETRIMLTFSGQVTGKLTDPESSPANNPVGGSHVTIRMAEGFQQRFTTNSLGEYIFEGVREGMFWLDAKDTASNRRAKRSGFLSAADPEPVVNLELERTETLHLSVYLPSDTGANSGVLAGPVEATVSQRSGDFYRSQQGNPIVMPQLFVGEPYRVDVVEIGGSQRKFTLQGSFPKGNSAQPLTHVYPAFGNLEVNVRRANGGVPDALVTVRISRYDIRTFYSDAAGRVVVTGVPLNHDFSITATTLDGSSGSTSVRVLRQSVAAVATIEVGSRAIVHGKVTAEAGGPSIGTPVVIRHGGGQLSGTTNDLGEFTFAGIAAPSGIEILYYGPDGSTLGARQTFNLDASWGGREYTAATVKLDATLPLLKEIIPAQGSNNVPPDTHLRFVFSEPIDFSTIHNDHFTLQPADGSPRVAATFTAIGGPNGTYIVTMVPPAPPAGQQFPLKSNTLYRLTVHANVRDLTGHTLGTHQGQTFTTADYVEPRVVATTPAAGQPIPEQITYEFRFNEPLDPAPFKTGGSGSFTLSRMSGPEETATVLENVPGTAYVDPITGISLFFAPSEATKANSFYRARFSGVRDLQGNLVPEQTYRWASFDTIRPAIVLPSPVPEGSALVSALTYKITPQLWNANADGTPAATPATDIDVVEYFRVENGVETFIKSVKAAPFAYEFVAPDAPPAGSTLTFRAKARDKSTNESLPHTLTLTVKPNQPPTVAVALDRTANVYAGEKVNATITTTDEVVELNVQLDVRATRTDNTEYRKVYPVTVKRNSLTDPWPTPVIAVDLPANLKGSSNVTFTAIATDMSGLTTSSTTAITLAVDTTAPAFVETTPQPWTEYAFGSKYQLTAKVTDVGTGVASVTFKVDDKTYTVTTATGGVYTSPQITVTANSVNTTKLVTIDAVDNAGNVGTHTFNVVYLAVDDPTVPAGEWLCPISGAVLPANVANYPLKLRIKATDDVSVTSVRFRLPGNDTPVDATLQNGEYTATVNVNTPAADTSDYIITAIVTDADPAHTQEYRVRLSFVAVDITLDATQAITASNAASYAGKSILLRGAQGLLVPHVPVQLKNLIVIDGASVQTLSTTTSTERRLDLTVTDNFYVDCSSTVDVTGRGYLGAWGLNNDGSETRNASDRGMTEGNTTTGGSYKAGGSHAGVAADYETNASVNVPYGSYAEPRSLGAGGGSNEGSSGGGAAGSGGGAIALTGTDARFVIAGSVRANGTTPSSLARIGAGAGGSIYLKAAEVVIGPAARVTANGGDKLPGGGGRIAIHASRTLTIPDNSVQARGGYNNAGETSSVVDGGAGTIYIVRPGETEGELRVSSYDDRNANTAHRARYTPVGTTAAELVFRTITVGPRAVLRLDQPHRVTATENGINVHATGLLVAHDAQPALTFTTNPPAGSTVWQNANVALTYDAASTDGISEVRILIPGAADKVEGFPAYPQTLGPKLVDLKIPASAPAGPITIKVRVTSRSGRTFETSADYTVSPDAAPAITFDSVTPSDAIYAGGTIAVSGTATDDVEVKSLDLSIAPSNGGTITRQAPTQPDVKTMKRSFTVALAKSVKNSVTLTLSSSDGFPGRPAATVSQTVNIKPDSGAPVVTITKPTAGQQFNEAANGTFTIEVAASDAEVGVDTVKATFEGTTYTLNSIGNGLYSVANVPIPAVEGSDPVAKTISVAVTDFEPNTTTQTATIYILPLNDPSAPRLSWTCSSPNAAYPAGFGAPVRVIALPPLQNNGGANGVNRVEFSVDGGTPVVMTASGTEYRGTYTVPAGTAAGTVLNLKIAAFSTSGAEANLFGTITVVAGSEVNGVWTMSATDMSLENQTLIVRSGGTLNVTGNHTFANLIILGGGKLVQKHTNLAEADTLTITGTFFVACDGVVDVTAQGFPAKTTYPGERAAAKNGGGSHIGRGGAFGDPGSTYGSVYRPKEAGAGEFSRAAGGGVVRITSAKAVIDGVISANGQNNGTHYEGAGGGGSVWIRTGSIRGGGRIVADGGTGHDYHLSNGGGGAIAVEYTDGASTVPAMHSKSGNHYNPYGGAGSQYTRGPQSVYGDIRFDNSSRNMDSPTQLPALGTHAVESFTAPATVTLASTANVRPYFAGHYLRIQAPDGSVRGIWRIASVTSPTQVVLEIDPARPFDVRGGDTARGAYRFDSITLTHAWVETTDLVLVGSTPVVDATSRYYPGNDAAPVVTPSLISFDMGKYGPVVVGAAGAVVDPDKPVDVTVTNAQRPVSSDQWLAGPNITFGTVGGFSIRASSNDSAYTKAGSADAAYISCRASQRNVHMDCALLTLTGTSRVYTFGIFNNGNWQIWVNGSATSTSGTYDTKTVFRVERSGGVVRFFVNGTQVRQENSDGAILHPYVAPRTGGEVNSLHFSSETNVPSRANVAADGSFTLGIAGAPGDAITLKATDANHYAYSTEKALGTIPADMSVASVTFAPASVTGGRTAAGTVTLGRPAGASGAVVYLRSDNAAAVVPASVAIAAGQTAGSFNVTTSGVPAPTPVTITATWGGAPQTGVLTLTRDEVAPTATITQPAANTQFNEGSATKIAVRATITDDDSGVKSARAFIDGKGYDLTKDTTAANTWKGDVPVPFVDGTANVTMDLTVVALDNLDNAGTSPAVPVVIKPVTDTNPPTLSWACSDHGALYPVGYGARLRVLAKAPNTTNYLHKVEFIVTDPAGTSTTYLATSIGSDLYEYVLTIPDAPDGTLYNTRVVVTTAGGTTAESTGSFTIVKGATEITANTTISATDTNYDNKSVVVRGGTTTIDGAHKFTRLIVLAGGTVTHAAGGGKRLEVEANDVFVECGSSIDAAGKGYPAQQSYPGKTPANGSKGGSHIGGGADVTIGSTFGSIYRPLESGGGGYAGAGGGVIRLDAGTLRIDGSVRASGVSNGGAGGSVWITAGRISGLGQIEANGGNANGSASYAGGGGVVSIEYTDPATVLPKTSVIGGEGTGCCSGIYREGGAGALFLKGPQSVHGDLTLGNQDASARPATELPSLGKGLAQTGSSGATLVTDLTADVHPFFAGHWVEITGADGALKGTYRIASISARTLLLEANGSDLPAVAAGDAWQGVYRFDNVTTTSVAVSVMSADPIRAGRFEAGATTTRIDSITADTVIVKGTVNRLLEPTITIDAKTELRVESGAVVSVVGVGWPAQQTNPAAVPANSTKGGSHIGRGANAGPGAVFGSVYRPRWSGGGGYGGAGGGVIRITSPKVVVNGTLTASGATNGGAGGSLWITAGHISGSGVIEASGANAANSASYAGGGGVVSVEYTDATSTLPTVRSSGGNGGGCCSGTYLPGAPGAVYLKGPNATYGDLQIINADTTNRPIAELPSLGSGTAQTGSTGATLVTDKTSIPPFFDVHWIEIWTAAGAQKGTYRVQSISGSTITLAAAANDTIAVQPGDVWYGVYRFDTFRQRGNKVISGDPIVATTMDRDNSVFNNGAPKFDAAKVQSIVLESDATGHYVRGTAGTVIDTNTPVVVTATNKRSNLTYTGNAAADGSFSVKVEGIDNDAFTVYATDADALRSRTVDVNGAIGANSIVSVTVSPASVGGGTPAKGTVTLSLPAGTSGVVVNLSSSSTLAAVPATITIASGALSGQFDITTVEPQANTDVVITAALGSSTRSATLTVTRDTTGPTVTITSPAADSQYTEGSATLIPVKATVVDDFSGIKRVFATIDGVNTDLARDNSQPNLYSGNVPAPFVDGDQNVTRNITVTGIDGRDNPATSAPLPVVIKPVVDPNAPTVTWSCSSDAIYPVGYTARLRVVAKLPTGSQNFIAKVDILVTDALGATTTLTAAAVSGVADAWEAAYVVPDVADGTAYTTRAVATTASGSTAQVTGSLTVVKDGVEMTGTMSIPATNTLYDNKSLIIRSGTTSISGKHTFARIVVLEGAKLDHPQNEQLDLTVTGGIYVACGGAIDATAKGFAVNATYPGEQVAADGNGGSHIGRGGHYNNPYGATYGSITRPREAGAGAGTCCGNAGIGGGVVRLQAQSVAVDGAIRANGQDQDRSAAGGSVWITTSRISGGGSIETNGGRGRYGIGAGGALAIEYTDPASTLPVLSSRTGANIGERRYGGAGSIYVKGPQSVFGDLTLDNQNIDADPRSAKEPVILPSLGTGTAQSGSSGATLVITRAKDVQAWFVGHWVEIYAPEGSLKGTWRVKEITTGKTLVLQPNGTETIDVAVGDTWRGVYRFDNVKASGVRIDSPDPIRITGTQTIEGTVEVEQITAGRIVVKGTLTHKSGASLVIEADDVQIDAGGAIDVTSRGFAPNSTYPNEQKAADGNGGSHIGRGGYYNTPYGSTFGSIYRPQEAGGGAGTCCGNASSGGGVVRINARNVVVNGAIRANGGDQDRTGAGGSVWITTNRIGGSGAIETNGGTGRYGIGGGGAIAIEYTDAASTLPALSSHTGANIGERRFGGPGSIWIKGPSSTYGDLTVDNKNIDASPRSAREPILLPSFGKGVAQPTTAGAVLVTDRAANVQPYHVGHWVEIYSPAGVLKGTWRIASVDGAKTVTLASNGGETVAVAAGDTWQGVYRFDNVKVSGVDLESADPIRVTGTQTVEGHVETERITTGKLVVKGTLTHAVGRSLVIKASELRVEAGASIDVTNKGYEANATHPNEQVAADGNGGSHIGRGGYYNNPYGATFGSIYRPQEAGGGAGTCCGNASRGGGVVRIDAPAVVVDGTIRANGGNHDRSGAGGSVWITAGRISGGGAIQTNGGTGRYGIGGGGAIAIEYSDATSTLPVLSSRTGANIGESRFGGPGSIWVKGASATYGDLTIDNENLDANPRSAKEPILFPSFGSGLAQAGSGSATLVTNRAVNIQQYFVGHWVEIYSPAGALKGTWRIASVDAAKTVTLAPNAAETINVAAGDTWQGIYRFDNLKAVGARIESADPIRVIGTQTVEGNVDTETIDAGKLVVKGTLTHRALESLTIKADEVHVETGASIDVTAKGYAPNATYPNEQKAADGTGGSHIGRGGLYNTPYGATYGSIYRPREAGGGAGTCCGYAGSGGGVVRIDAGSLVAVHGAIRADGQRQDRSAAGGSIWITTPRITGTGTITANGGDGRYGIGGGGAIAIEYTDATSTLPVLSAKTGTTYGEQRQGGAGSIYVRRTATSLGELTIENAGPLKEPTILPSLGAGSAIAGSSGSILVTDRTTNIQPYFAGHWVEVSAGGAVKGMWRIASINAKTITLEPGANVQPGDTYRGVYRFDRVTLRTHSVISGDAILSTEPIDKGTTIVDVNDGPPVFPSAKRSQIVVDNAVTGDAVTGPAGAVTDASAPVKLTVTNVRTAAAFTGNANADGSFRVSVNGIVGDTFTVAATDSHTVPLTSAQVPVTGTIAELNTLSALTIEPSTTAGGTTVYGSLRLTHPARALGATVSLASNSPAATVPATFTVPGGATTVQFPIITSSPATQTRATITATLGASSQQATLDVTTANSALTDLVLTSTTVEGGTSVNGTVLLGAPAPAGGALISLLSTAPEAVVPDTVLVPEGSTQASFSIATSKVGAAMRVGISATWTSTISRNLDLTACAAMTSPAAPASTSMTTMWIDDAAPAGATATGDATFDNTQAAAGTLSLHFAPPAAANIRTWSFTAATTPLTVTPADTLVLYALVNPCKPPRQLMVQWSDGTTSYRASWGESGRITGDTASTVHAGSVPVGGQWTRLEVAAQSFGINANKSLTALTVSVDGGEAWIDAMGVAACAVPKAAKPSYLKNEVVWFDDALPAGAIPASTYSWDSTQVASGTLSAVVGSPGNTSLIGHSFTAATPALSVKQEDMLIAYVFLDPCNPPREVVLQFNDGSSWSRKAYWGENLFESGSHHSVERYWMGAMPQTGKWVRLEVPASSMVMGGMSLRGVSFTIHSGRAWFDRVATTTRVNLALGKPASHSSTRENNTASWGADKVVDGSIVEHNNNITNSEAQAWWQVDLGNVQPIDSIDIWNISQCCAANRLSNFYVHVSDEPFTSTSVTTTLNQAGVTSYFFLREAGRPQPLKIDRTGRYVRVQLVGTNYLHISEVQVWAPVAEGPVNLSGGRPANHSSTDRGLLAVGAVNGSSLGESNSHTLSNLEAWWEVDLESIQSIATLEINNAFSSPYWQRMANFYVFVSDQPLPSTYKVADALADPKVSAYYRVGPLSTYKFDVNRTGRYVRIQLTGTNYLHPMEVRLWSPSLTVTPLSRTPDVTSSTKGFDFASAYRAGGR